jgi:peptidoglycan hydrolase-like protein with peptidoglycan-binding domain
MGAIQRGRPPCGDDAFGHGDTHEGGEAYAACFAIYPSRAAGWEALVNELYLRRSKVLAAARNCDMMGAVAAMRASQYFEAPLEHYQEGIRARVAEIASALGEPNPVPKAGVGGSLAGGSPSPAVPRTISRGAKGTEVRAWQCIAGTTVDGTFGLLTELATIRWQGRHELKPDGIVGPKTWKKALG